MRDMSISDRHLFLELKYLSIEWTENKKKKKK